MPQAMGLEPKFTIPPDLARRIKEALPSNGVAELKRLHDDVDTNDYSRVVEVLRTYVNSWGKISPSTALDLVESGKIEKLREYARKEELFFELYKELMESENSWRNNFLSSWYKQKFKQITER